MKNFAEFMKGGKMSKEVLYFLIITGLCFSQTAQLGAAHHTHRNFCNKSMSIEILGGAHFTLEHEMGFIGIWLPIYMAQGGGRIAYQPTSNVVLSLLGSYCHARDLNFKWASPFPFPVLKFTFIDADFLISYTNRITKNLSYLIGSGIDVSYIRVFADDTTEANNDTTVSSTYLRPLLSGGLKFNISDPLYLQVQAKSSFYHFLKTGAENIHLGNILPSVSLSIGYTFSFKRRKS